MNKWIRILIFILICQMAGVIGSFFTIPKITGWYATLQKPSFTPPNWLFGPVWTTLFALMGVSLYWIWGFRLEKNFKRAISFFGVQFVLNILWNFFFFGLQNPLIGLIEIILLWIAIAVTIFEFYKLSKKAGLILLPYIIWVSIATVLNYYILVLNA